MEKNNVLSTIVFIGAIISLLYAIYYIQQLSLNIGIGAGINAIANTNANIIINSTLVQLANNIPTLNFALYISYIAFVLSVIMVAIGAVQLLSKRGSIEWSATLLISSIAYIAVSTSLETSFSFQEPYTVFSLSYLGAIVVLLASVAIIIEARRTRMHSISRNIKVDPSKPYTNMIKLSDELFSKLKGNIKILDMHFDSLGLKNLAILLDNNNTSYSSIYILANEDRLGTRFMKEYNDFKNEMKNKNILFELRILDENDAIQQHERLLMDSSNAYKIPPFNIINRKSEHIVRINYKDANNGFEYLWSRAKKLENINESK